MKTIFTLLLSTLFSLVSMAYDGARLTISTLSTNKMFVEVDGRRYNLDEKTLSLGNIRPGDHNVRVLREVKRKSGWNSNIRNKREEVIYSIKLSLRNGYHFDILVNRFGKVLIDERMIDRNADWYDEEDDNYYDRDNDQDEEWNNDRDDEDLEDRNDRDNRGDEDRDDRDNRDPRDDDNYSRAMRDLDFSQAKETIRKEWFENTRLTTAKQVIDRNYFTSQQVKELMFLFSFENNRLDIAKYAYRNTVDKRNYAVVNDAFTFNSKEKLDQYIREYGKQD